MILGAWRLGRMTRDVFSAEYCSRGLRVGAMAPPAALPGRAAQLPAPPKIQDLRPTAAPHMQASFRLRILDGGPVDAFVGFFDVQFRGSRENPAQMEVLLSTAPDATGATHWGQQVRWLQLRIEGLQ
jgi:hypothetical protein